MATNKNTLQNLGIQTHERENPIQALKPTIAAFFAWLLCNILLKEQAPIFGAIAALLSVQPNITKSFKQSIERSVGVTLGVAVGILIIFLFGTPSWLLLLLMILIILICWFTKLSTSVANQIVITALLLFSFGKIELDYAYLRFVETIIGGIVGIAVNVLIAAPVKISPAHVAVNTLGHSAAKALDDLAEIIVDTSRIEKRVSNVRENIEHLWVEREETRSSLGDAQESLELNPWKNKHKTQQAKDEQVMRLLSPIVTQIHGMTLTVCDNYRDSLIKNPIMIGLIDEPKRAAHDLRRACTIDEDIADEVLPDTSPLPALTTPFKILKPDEENWIVLGSVMEDLRRIGGGIFALNTLKGNDTTRRKH